MRMARLRLVPAFALVGALAFSSACNDSKTPTETFELGSVTAIVLSGSSNTPVSGVAVDLRLASDKTIWRTARTGSTGTIVYGANEGGVLAASYVLRFQSEGQFQLVSGETNDRPVTVTAGSNTTVTFRIAPSGAAPIPG